MHPQITVTAKELQLAGDGESEALKTRLCSIAAGFCVGMLWAYFFLTVWTRKMLESQDAEFCRQEASYSSSRETFLPGFFDNFLSYTRAFSGAEMKLAAVYTRVGGEMSAKKCQ
ncbi:MAG: hypothetical protein Q4E11_02370 [Corynebacterium sp.]|uniref:hypothetical protein n=1 Tax=Corynebacterium sp. TaxID=1720 RepID=UPI0026DD7242|nr:hypothetical protein [Corynebacterium sp.]MDO5029412.1 hypothetical protein [Corynebacterium sp.]